VKPDAENLEEVLKEYSSMINKKTRETYGQVLPVVVAEKYEEQVEQEKPIVEDKGTMLQQLLMVDKHTLNKQYKNYLLERKLLEEQTGEKQPLILPIQPGNEIYIETQNPDGTISVRPRFPAELNYYFRLLSDYKKYELLIRPEADQLRVLNNLAERERAKQPQQQQQQQLQQELEPQYAPGSPAYVPSDSEETTSSPGYIPESSSSPIIIVKEPESKSSILTLEKEEEKEEGGKESEEGENKSAEDSNSGETKRIIKL
jgi:hypothetical protein